LGKFEEAVEKAVSVKVTENQFSAMVSLCYNIGPGAFAKSSVVKHTNAGDTAKAASSFLLWNKAGGKELPGLTRRREAEKKLFLA
jgi:lysozyme